MISKVILTRYFSALKFEGAKSQIWCPLCVETSNILEKNVILCLKCIRLYPGTIVNGSHNCKIKSAFPRSLMGPAPEFSWQKNFATTRLLLENVYPKVSLHIICSGILIAVSTLCAIWLSWSGHYAICYETPLSLVLCVMKEIITLPLSSSHSNWNVKRNSLLFYSQGSIKGFENVPRWNLLAIKFEVFKHDPLLGQTLLTPKTIPCNFRQSNWRRTHTVQSQILLTIPARNRVACHPPIILAPPQPFFFFFFPLLKSGQARKQVCVWVQRISLMVTMDATQLPMDLCGFFSSSPPFKVGPENFVVYTPKFARRRGG